LAGEKLQLVAVEACERILGTEHPHILIAIARLATMHRKQQQAEAEKTKKAAMEAKMKAITDRVQRCRQ
jgi:hypothetical protein